MIVDIDKILIYLSDEKNQTLPMLQYAFGLNNKEMLNLQKDLEKYDVKFNEDFTIQIGDEQCYFDNKLLKNIKDLKAVDVAILEEIAVKNGIIKKSEISQGLSDILNCVDIANRHTYLCEEGYIILVADNKYKLNIRVSTIYKLLCIMVCDGRIKCDKLLLGMKENFRECETAFQLYTDNIIKYDEEQLILHITKLLHKNVAKKNVAAVKKEYFSILESEREKTHKLLEILLKNEYEIQCENKELFINVSNSLVKNMRLFIECDKGILVIYEQGTVLKDVLSSVRADIVMEYMGRTLCQYESISVVEDKILLICNIDLSLKDFRKLFNNLIMCIGGFLSLKEIMKDDEKLYVDMLKKI